MISRLFLPLFALAIVPGLHAATVANLRCEYVSSPQGIDTPKPRFFWEDRSDERGFQQTAWQIILQQDGQTVWDSTQIKSDDSIQIEYPGAPLQSDTIYTWRVRVWDAAGNATDWSKPASFSTGMFTPEDWKAKWIARRPEPEWQARYQASRQAELQTPGPWQNTGGQPRDPILWVTTHPKPYDPDPILRKGFTLRQPVKEALLHVTGVGYYQLYLNGKRIDGGALAPGVTDYDKRVLYDTYDLSKVLQQGPNCLGLMLGRGWFNELCADGWGFWKAPWVAQTKAIAQLRVTLQDGTVQTVVTDASWKVADGPVTFDDLRIGDVYDATKEIPRWSEASFDDKAWAGASVVPAPAGKLAAEIMAPILPMTKFKATACTPNGSDHVVDVTAKIASLVTNQTLTVVAGDGLCGSDPAPGVVKMLRVDYTQDGEDKTATASEGSPLTIPAGTGELVIRKAVFGEISKPSYLYDFPQNIACQAQFHFDGTGLRGQAIKFTFYTYRDPAGQLGDPSGVLSSYYISKGAPDEIVSLPQFGYVGGHYVTVEGLAKPPALADMTLLEVRSGVPDAGDLVTSDPLLNRIHHNIRFTEASALHSYPQDCWTREKLGWTGDAHLTCEEALFNFDMGALYTKWMQDHLDIQGPDGGIIPTVPCYKSGNEGSTWCGTGIIIPWHLYEYYGDTRLLGQMRDSGARYLSSLTTMAGKPDIYFGGPSEWAVPWGESFEQLGDHHPENGVPVSFFPEGGEGQYVYGTEYYYRLANLLQNMAKIVGKPDEIPHWQDRKDKVRDAFTVQYYDPKKKAYHGDNPTEYKQAINILALWFNMVPEKDRPEIIANLVGDIVARKENHLNTAVLGTQALFEELPKLGLTDLAYKIALQKTYPGYLWPILTYGLTTLPETWDAFGGTHEHPFFGSVDAFFYKWVGGIQPDPAAPGFKHFFLRPSIDNPLTFSKASYSSIRGLIRCEWRKDGANLLVDVEVPANTTADLDLPTFGYAHPQIEESGKPLAGADQVAGANAPAVVVHLAGGTYHFRVTSTEPLARARAAHLDLTIDNAVVYPGESALMTVQATGRLDSATLTAVGTGGVKIDAVTPKGSGAWDVKLTAPAEQPAWRAEPVDLALIGSAGGQQIEMKQTVRVAVRAPVEIRFPTPEINVTQNHDTPQTIFYLYSQRSAPTDFSLSPTLPEGMQGKLLVDGQVLPTGGSFTLKPRIFTKVELSSHLNNPLPDAQQAKIDVVQGGKTVGTFQCPLNFIPGPLIESFHDDFSQINWHTEGTLKITAKDGHAEVFVPDGHADPMYSDWMVMDCSIPLVATVKTSSVSSRWALQIDDGTQPRTLIGDTSSPGVVQSDFSSLNLSGPRRFRLKFYGVAQGGDCRIDLQKISIAPKTDAIDP